MSASIARWACGGDDSVHTSGGAALTKHPKGDLLVDTGFGRDIDQQFATMPRSFQKLTKYELWKSARNQLEAAGYDFDGSAAFWSPMPTGITSAACRTTGPSLQTRQGCLQQAGHARILRPAVQPITFQLARIRFRGGALSRVPAQP